MEKYITANPRILWVLKQSIHNGQDDQSVQIAENINRISSSPTWSRLAHASLGILLGKRDFDMIKNNGIELGESLLSTAIIEANKELGESRSYDQKILDGYYKYETLILKQIDAYLPDVVIVAMVGINESLKPITESIYKHFTGEPEYVIDGHSKPSNADVAWSRTGNKIFLWAYHPAYPKIARKDYFDGLMNAYDAARTHGTSSIE